MTATGLLIVVTDAPSAFEEELNAWYDLEHIPERAAIPGFMSALRFVSLQRPRRYLALYDLTEVEVLDSEPYKAFAGENFTPWTKRVVARARFQRWEAVRLPPGSEPTASASRLLLMRFAGLRRDGAGHVVERVRASLADTPGIVQLRAFIERTGERPAVFLTVAGHGDLEAVPRDLPRPDLVETFAPY